MKHSFYDITTNKMDALACHFQTSRLMLLDLKVSWIEEPVESESLLIGDSLDPSRITGAWW